MAYAIDLVGERFGRLLVISRNYEAQTEYFKNTGCNKAFWNCICDCGNNFVASSNGLRYGDT